MIDDTPQILLEKQLLKKFLTRLDDSCTIDNTVEILFRYLLNLHNIFSAELTVLLKIPTITEHLAMAISTFVPTFDSIEESSLRQCNVNSENFKNYLIKKLSPLRSELFYAVVVTKSDKFESLLLLTKGDSISVKLSYEELLKRILETRASRILLVHNHPNSLPNPSYNDIETTYLLYNNLKKFEITLADHFIVGQNNVLSLKDNHFFDKMDCDLKTFSKLAMPYAK